MLPRPGGKGEVRKIFRTSPREKHAMRLRSGLVSVLAESTRKAAKVVKLADQLSEEGKKAEALV